jgi:hypothetical protein
MELNKKIAKLKGIPYSNFDPRDVNPNWEENIADAWELFEEIKYQVLIVKWADGEYVISYVNAKNIYNPKKIILGEAKTAPEAICKAWIAWKENEKDTTKEDGV